MVAAFFVDNISNWMQGSIVIIMFYKKQSASLAKALSKKNDLYIFAMLIYQLEDT
jgi:hypothetical protein